MDNDKQDVLDARRSRHGESALRRLVLQAARGVAAAQRAKRLPNAKRRSRTAVMRSCPNCGDRVDDSIRACPNCSTEINPSDVVDRAVIAPDVSSMEPVTEWRRPHSRRRWLIVIALLAVAGLALPRLVSSNGSSSAPRQYESPLDAAQALANDSAPTSPAASVNPVSMTLDEFDRIAAGMSYQRVVAIVGGPGEVLSESDVAGLHTIMYKWDGEGDTGANASVMFQDDAEINKAQFGLR